LRAESAGLREKKGEKEEKEIKLPLFDIFFSSPPFLPVFFLFSAT
jgi:hypothetical protein